MDGRQLVESKSNESVHLACKGDVQGSGVHERLFLSFLAYSCFDRIPMRQPKGTDIVVERASILIDAVPESHILLIQMGERSFEWMSRVASAALFPERNGGDSSETSVGTPASSLRTYSPLLA